MQSTIVCLLCLDLEVECEVRCDLHFTKFNRHELNKGKS